MLHVAQMWLSLTSLLFDGNSVSLPLRIMPGALLCLSEFISGGETVERPGLPVLPQLSYQQRLLTSVLTPLLWNVIIQATSSLGSDTCIAVVKIARPRNKISCDGSD